MQNNIKEALAIALLALSFTAIIGFATAYFSDIINVSGGGTMGTLDLVKGEQTIAHYYNLAGESEVINDALGNINPGDRIVVGAGITNAGNKSAWVRSRLSINGFNADEVEVYAGDVDYADKDTAVALALADGVYTTPTCVLNGTGNINVEEDATPENACGASMMLTVFVSPELTNEFQGRVLADLFSLDIEAIQYRNNNGADFSTVVAQPFSQE